MIHIQYLILSLVQAATEFLPVSSSGHLLFFKGLFQTEEIPLIFDIIIHVGSLAAIVIYYFANIKNTLVEGWRDVVLKREKKRHFIFLLYLALSTVVTFSFYLLLKDAIESRYETPSTLKFTFLITSVILLLTKFLEGRQKRQISQTGWHLPVIAGLFQGLAILPGVSRSGSTISSLLYLGINRKDAAFYSFFLAVPAILGALVFKLAELESATFLEENLFIVTLSFAVSVVFSYLFLRLLTYLLNKGRFWLFGVYTLAMAVAAFILF